jgi:hypothetical protein
MKNLQPGLLISGLRFEPGTSQIQTRGAHHYTMTFDEIL